LNASGGRFDIEGKKKEIVSLEQHSGEQGFWNDANNARALMGKLNSLKKTVSSWESQTAEAASLGELQKMADDEKDETMSAEVNEHAEKLRQAVNNLEIQLKLAGEFDRSNAIVAIHAGAGGTESCDWAEMLLRMYNRWAERKGFEVEVLDILAGEEAGIKSATFLVKGEFAYGLMQSELGVHRLVRISPFDANKRRHTSFTSVDVIPEIDDNIDIVIEDKDLRIDTYRASGHGGQYMNKTDSAVRITHIPSGIIIACQSERSQIKNRATAMKLLKSRLYEAELDKKRKATEKHYDEKGSIAWGSQIRSYVFMPYQLVKDHRTGAEIAQVDKVMDGEIDPFISAYLDKKLAGK
jgi:peptide chain release factor 2